MATRSIQERFEEFDRENPHVYTQLVALTNQAYETGRNKIGMKMLFELLRWNHRISTNGKDFKLSNDYTSRYARKIMHEYPRFNGIFNTKDIKD